MIGPPGAGKTALLHVILGFVRPTRGTVRFSGRDVTATPPERRGIAAVFAEDALLPHKTVLENAAFALKLRRVSRTERDRRAASALAACGVGSGLSRHVAQLGPADRRRVAIARSLAVAPSLILLDHPPGAAAELPEAVRSIPGVIFATADVPSAFPAAGRLLLLRAGRVVQEGSAADLYQNPRTAFVARYTGPVTFLPGTLRTGSGGSRLFEAAGEILPAAPPPAGLPNGAAAICLRPHAIRLEAHGPLAAVVMRIAHLGAAARITAASRVGPVTFDLADVPAGLAPGTAIRLAWDAGAAKLIPWPEQE